jgi:hypothetical protein
LYDLAKDLDRNKWQRNLFKSYYKYKPASALGAGGSAGTTWAAPQLANSWVAISNPHVSKQADITDTLNGKGRSRTSTEAEELISMMEPGENN